MSERSLESLSGVDIKTVTSQKEGAKVLTPQEIITLPNNEFEERLDEVFGEKKPNDVLNETDKPKKEPQENEDISLSKRLTAAATVGSLLFGAGVALSPTEAKAETRQVSPSGMPSQAALDNFGIIASAGATDVVTPAPNPEPVGSEATPSVLDLVTAKYIVETRNMVMDLSIPLPMERIRNCFEAWKLRAFGPYEDELRKLGAENEARIKFGARVLYAYDNPMLLSSESGDLFENYVSRDEIVDYVLTGKNKNVLVDGDKNPVIWMVNMTDKMKKDFKKAIKKLEKSGIKNTYDALRDCGSCVYFTAKLDPTNGPGTGLLVETGVINSNMDEVNTKGIDLTNMFGSILVVEPVGVAYYQLTKSLGMGLTGEVSGSKWVNYCEMVKDIIAGNIVSYMGGGFSTLKDGFFSQANGYADKDGLSVDSDLSQRLIQLILETINVAGEDLLSK